ncbi:spore germination protein [Cohnella nanjingensis]|uniref:Spore germination protein n=1 Tax=Cohnella nanjingensis TaxID=1387779 RepID=A0A7X0RRQ9_9BACL|nr:spore germination protein [Cohnella nanjingensis]MBB6672321.1 spore germination protein [Cohnella nanjingensis]
MLKEVRDQLGNPDDLITETMDNGYTKMEFCFFPGMCDINQVKDGILVPFSYRFDPDEFRRMLHADLGFIRADKPEEWSGLLLKGFVLLQYEGETFAFGAIRKMQTKPDPTQVEASLQGPQSAYTEDLDLNLNLIRTLYNSKSLGVEWHEKNDIASQSRIMLLYDRDKVDPTTLKEVRSRLDEVDKNLILAAGQLVKLMSHKRHRMFPVILVTERPDRTAMHLNKGKIVIMLDGSRFVLLMPVRFFDFLSAMDDYYEPFWMSRFLIVLRYIAMLLTLTLPALYISVVSYNPEVFRVQLAFTIDGSRAAVPYPSFIEVLIMLFMIEALIEASIRLPRFVGSTAATVGGLILGQAAQQAALVSSIMIIVTSVVAISNFVIPNSTFSYFIRVLKYLFVAVSIFSGLIGVVVTLFMLIVYLCNMRSFGEPYFALFINEKKKKNKRNPAHQKAG